jgi:hypothetical protein
VETMTDRAALPAENTDPALMPGMTVERVLAHRQPASRLTRVAAAGWLSLVALALGFSVFFARAARSHRAATTVTITLSLLLSAWLAATVLPERVQDGASGAVEPTTERVETPQPPPVAAVSPEPPSLPVAALQARDVWVGVKKPFAVYHVEAPELDQANLVHRVSNKGRHARQDSFLWTNSRVRPGSLQRPAIHLVIERHENSLPTARPLFPDLALRAAEIGVSIERLQGASEVMTKFGTMEVAEALLDSEQGRLACLAFRRSDTAGLVLAGWYCGTADRPADRVSFPCFIDRIDLVGSGQDRALRQLFAQAERQRKGCPNLRQPGRKVTWLDHEAPLPAMKLSHRRD